MENETCRKEIFRADYFNELHYTNFALDNTKMVQSNQDATPPWCFFTIKQCSKNLARFFQDLTALVCN